MNHPEFSNKENSDFFMSKNNFYAASRTVSRYARKACGKGFLGVTLFFCLKIFDFFQKNDFAPKNPIARLSSVARNSTKSSVKVIFRHKKTRILFVRKFGMIHVLLRGCFNILKTQNLKITQRFSKVNAAYGQAMFLKTPIR